VVETVKGVNAYAAKKLQIDESGNKEQADSTPPETRQTIIAGGAATGANTVPTHKAPPPAIPVSKLTYTQEQTSSRREDAPYAIKVVIQTNVPLQPTSIAVKCNMQVAYGEFHMSGPTTFLSAGQVVDRSVYWFFFDQPTFKPETPIVLLLMAKAPISVIGVDYGPRR